VLIDDRPLNAGDAIASDQAGDLKIIAQGDAEILIFDLA
jgi:hypothetical protein